jgi:hypothetical protein
MMGFEGNLPQCLASECDSGRTEVPPVRPLQVERRGCVLQRQVKQQPN